MGFRDGEGEPMGLSGMRERMMLLFLFNIKTSPLFEDVFLTVWLKRLKAQKLLDQGVWGIAFFLFKNYLKIRVVSLSLSNSSWATA